MRKVSIYIPCYNAGEYIDECLRGVENQTYPIDETLIIDDGSTDNTADKALKHPVKVIRHSENKGLAAARNTGIQNAKNKFVASVDADCVPEKTWLKNLISNFTSENIAGVGGRLIETYSSSLPDRWRAYHLKQDLGERKIYDPKFLFGSNTIFRKRVLDDVGLYNVKYKTNYEDYDMSQRLKSRAYKIIYEPDSVVYHLRKDTLLSVLNTHWRWHFGGIMGRRAPDTLYNLLCKNYDAFWALLPMIKNDLFNCQLRFVLLDIVLPVHHLYCDYRYWLRAKNKSRQKGLRHGYEG